MKRKTLKRAMAGAAAITMLASSVPASMIASAGDPFYGVKVTDTEATLANAATSNLAGDGTRVANPSEDGFGAFYNALMAEYNTAAGAHALEQSWTIKTTCTPGGGLAPLGAGQGGYAGKELNAAAADFTLGTFDYKMTRYVDKTGDRVLHEEVKASDGTVTTPAIYYSTKWNTTKAAEEIVSYIDGAKKVTFYTNQNDANWGKIKTITMNMPYNNNGVIAYKDIEFLVVRTEGDLKKAVENRENGIILAKSITSGESASSMEGKPVFIDGNKDTGEMNLNLNGYKVETDQGFQVSGATLKIWGGRKSNGTPSTITTHSTSTGSSIVLFNETAEVEIYDGVLITSGASCASAAVSGVGKFVCCGDANILNGNNGALAIETGTGKITVVENGYKITEIDVAGSTVKERAEIRKVRKYNKDGVEVTEAGAYVDIDPTVSGIQYSFQPAYAKDTTTEVDLANGLLTAASTDPVELDVANAGQLYWVAKHINDDDLVNPTVTSPSVGRELTIKLTADIDAAAVSALKAFTPMDVAGDLDLGNVTFNGDSHVISNLKIAVSSGSAGLFSYGGRTDPNPAGPLDCPQTVTIQNLGMEKPNVTAGSTGYASAIIGEGYGAVITNCYVLDPTLAGGYTGALAGSLDGDSHINHTYSSGKYNGIRYLTDNATKNYLKSSTEFTNNGKTNFYNKTKLTETRGDTASYMIGATDEEFTKGKVAFMLNGHNPAQVVDHSFIALWDEGKNETSGSYSVYDSSTGGYPTLTARVRYNADVFGQTFEKGKTSYPTFLKVTKTETVSGTAIKFASNRVFRQAVVDCSGDMQDWDASNAQFGNDEEDKTSGGHVDVKSSTGNTPDGRCDKCGAYEIANEKNFDPIFWPFLASTDEDEYNTTAANSLDGKFINLATIGGMTTVTIDLTKANSTKTVDEIVDALNILDKDGKCSLVGFDTLCKNYSSGKELSSTNLITNVNFIVDDEIICKVYGDDGDLNGEEDISELGFKISSINTGSYFKAPLSWTYNFAQNAGFVMTDKDKQIYDMAYTASLITQSVTESSANASQKATAKTAAETALTSSANHIALVGNNWYASADTSASASLGFVSFRNDPSVNISLSSASATKTSNPYIFTIHFSGIKHNDSRDYDKGTGEKLVAGSKTLRWNTVGTTSETYTNNTYATANNIGGADYDAYKLNSTLNNSGGSMAKAVEIIKDDSMTIAGDPYKYHQIQGIGCKCTWLEEHDADYAITKDYHDAACVVCTHQASASDFVTGSTKEPHKYEVVAVMGKLTFKRCIVCGYATFARDTSITPVSTHPTLSVTKGEKNDFFKQSYDFSINAGDNTIISYGVVYSNDPKKHVDTTKFTNDSGSADNNLNNDAYLNKTGSALGTKFITTQGLGSTSKKAIKTSGTYRVGWSDANENAVFEACGYIIYQKPDKSYGVEYTEILSSTFYDAAYEEAVNACTMDNMTPVQSPAGTDKYTFNIEVSGKFTVSTYGVIYSKAAASPVTDKTFLKNVDGTSIMKVDRKSAVKAGVQTIKYNQPITRAAAATKTTCRGYLVVTSAEYKNLTFDIYTDSMQGAA